MVESEVVEATVAEVGVDSEVGEAGVKVKGFSVLDGVDVGEASESEVVLTLTAPCPCLFSSSDLACARSCSARLASMS